MFSWCKCKKTLVVNVGVQVVPSYIAYITWTKFAKSLSETEEVLFRDGWKVRPIVWTSHLILMEIYKICTLVAHQQA
jgi:hypothetical protein